MKKLRFVVAAIVLAGCAHAPTGPSVMVLPGSGKSAEQFRTEDATCRQMAAGEMVASKGGNVSDQKRYDMAYIQCMYAQGNQVPVFNRQGYSTPYGSAPSTSTRVTPPAGTPPPPAGTPPPPPPSR
jgi:hypothetical protein